MAAALMVAKAGFDFVGSIYQGEQAGREANARGDIAMMNARIAREQSNARLETERRANRMRMGEVRASAAETGFNANEGSLAALQTRSAAEMELDALTTQYEGQLQSLSFENEAAGHRASAKNARKSGYLNAFGSLIGNGANYFGQPRIGNMAPVETRTPKPNPNYKG